MTPKEKAIAIYDRMVVDFKIDKWQCKHCALVAVDEILDILIHDINPLVNYWFEVKEEIEKL